MLAINLAPLGKGDVKSEDFDYILKLFCIQSKQLSIIFGFSWKEICICRRRNPSTSNPSLYIPSDIEFIGSIVCINLKYIIFIVFFYEFS